VAVVKEHIAAGPQSCRVHPLDSQAGFGVGAGPVDLAVVLDPEAVQGHPHRGRAQAGGGRQHVLPVLADSQRHPGGGERLELGRADMVGEQPEQLRHLGCAASSCIG
jgi:hypothetical protein